MFCTIRLKKRSLTALLALTLAVPVFFYAKTAIASNQCIDCAAATLTNVPVSAEKSVYLTFDDGPSPVTAKILDILKDENVPATFFVIADDNSKPYFNLLTRAENEGHTIALHTATHDYKKIYRSTDDFWEDIEMLKSAIYPYLKKTPNILRFPGGSTNTVYKKYGPNNLMSSLAVQALDKGYTYFDWNVCVNDSVGSKKSSSEIVRAATHVGKKASCIILFHDSKSNASTADAVREIITWYKDNGYAFYTLDNLVN